MFRAIVLVQLFFRNITIFQIAEVFSIAFTALLPVILFPLTRGLTSVITNTYGDLTIFLFLGAFFIAIALEKGNLHGRIALNIILLVGTDTKRFLFGFMNAMGSLFM